MSVGRGSWNWDVWGQGVGSALWYSPRAQRRSEGGLKTGGFLVHRAIGGSRWGRECFYFSYTLLFMSVKVR